MIQDKKLRLLNVWKTQLFNELTIEEVMKKAGKKTKTWVFNSLKVLEKNKLLISRKKANISLYRLNINNPLLIRAISYITYQENLNFPELKIITKIIKDIPSYNYCLIVFGSYAENKQKKSSDLDLCILIEDKKAEAKIKPYVNDVKLNFTLNVDEHYITFSDFVKMLLRKEENLAKEIVRKNILFFNPDIYYKIMIEAHNNGFRN